RATSSWRSRMVGSAGERARISSSPVRLDPRAAASLRPSSLFERRSAMKARTRNLLLAALAGLRVAGAATESPGCTDFRIKAADGTVIIGRTMDFEVPVLSFVRIFPQGERWSSDAPGMKKGIGWTSRYGYAAIDMGGRLVDPLDRAENLADGLNEKGLSFGW